jgi:antitoxin YefM
MTYRESRAKYAELLDSVINDREEVVITRAGKDPVVIIPLDEYESIRETLYLMSNPANDRHLRASIAQLRS